MTGSREHSRVWVRLILEGVGSALLLLPYYLELLTSSKLFFYHHTLPVNHLVGGYLIDLIAVALTVTAFLAVCDRSPGLWGGTSRVLFAGLMVWRFVDLLLQSLSGYFLPFGNQILFHVMYWWNRARTPAALAIPLVAGACFFVFPRAGMNGLRVVRIALVAFAACGILIAPSLLRLALPPSPGQNEVVVPPAPAALTGSASFNGLPHRRVIWILFDELSYDQTFDHPQAGISLPNLAMLRATSISFSHVLPVGFYTNRIVLSLLVGHQITDIRSSTAGDLWYRDETREGWVRFNANASLFGIAAKNRWASGVAGCCNPYCRILGELVSSCFSVNSMAAFPTELLGASEERSVFANSTVLPAKMWEFVMGHSSASASTHVADYESIMAQTTALIADERIQFVFIHLPIPHPPGIYDRSRQVVRPGGSYLDNLELTDLTLGTLQDKIKATASAAQTIVIVSSDHSWRVPLWKPLADWKVEEERATSGHFDNRPVFVVHFPGETSREESAAATPEVLEHDIIAALLDAKINSPEDMAPYLSQGSH